NKRNHGDEQRRFADQEHSQSEVGCHSIKDFPEDPVPEEPAHRIQPGRETEHHRDSQSQQQTKHRRHISSLAVLSFRSSFGTHRIFMPNATLSSRLTREEALIPEIPYSRGRTGAADGSARPTPQSVSEAGQEDRFSTSTATSTNCTVGRTP